MSAQSGRAAAARPRLYSIDALRGVAAVGVVIWHYQWYFGRQVFPLLFQPVYSNGQLLVDTFFAISGFILSYSYCQRISSTRELIAYVGSRISRLYPLHVATLFATAALFAGMRARGLPFGFFYDSVNNDRYHFFLNLGLLQQVGLQRGYSFDAPSWSISTELWVSFLLGPLLWLPKKLRWLPLIALTLATCWLRACYYHSLRGPLMVDMYLVRTAAGVLTGALAYQLWSLRPSWNTKLAGSCLLAGAGLTLWALQTPAPNPLNRVAELVAASAGGALLVVGAASSKLAERISRRRPLVWLGDVSFSLYLWHYPLVAALSLTRVSEHVLGEDMFLLYLVAVFALATASQRWIERPTRGLFAALLGRVWPVPGVTTKA